jgi:hypothetical protein
MLILRKMVKKIIMMMRRMIQRLMWMMRIKKREELIPIYQYR